MHEHGNYKVEVFDKTVSVIFKGMFNLLASENVCQIVEDHISSFNGEGFYMMINLIDYEGSTPEAHEAGNQHAMWLESQNCLGKAVIIQTKIVLDIVRNQQEFLNKSQINTRVFESESDAKAWLESLT